MIFLQPNNSRKSDQIVAATSVGVYLLLLLAFILLVRFSVRDVLEKPDNSGVLINFGDRSLGYGERVSPKLSQTQAAPPEEQPAPKSEATDEVVTDDKAEDAVIEAKEPAKPKEKPKEKPQPKKPEPKKPEPKKQEVKPKEPEQPVVNTGALYKKPKETNTAEAGDGESHGGSVGKTGNTGSPDGDVGAPGAGGISNKFSLSGRALLGGLTKPIYEDKVSGQVVIEIQVNREGRVIETTFKPQNSTITSRKIIEAARKAASETRFNVSQSAAFTQIGTITYLFKVE